MNFMNTFLNALNKLSLFNITQANNGYMAFQITGKQKHQDFSSFILVNDPDPEELTNGESCCSFAPSHRRGWGAV